MDRYVRDIQNGVDREKRLRLFVMGKMCGAMRCLAGPGATMQTYSCEANPTARVLPV